jgi:hypothetical protein
LWSRRDRDGEAIRNVLRRGGFHDMDERHLDGFAVEGSNSSPEGREPYTVSYGGQDAAVLQRYMRLLQEAGYKVAPDPDPDWADTLVVQWQPAYAVLKVPRPGRALLGWAIVCAALAAIALLVSWTGSGQVRLAGGVGSAVFGVLAVLLAGVRYRRAAAEQEPVGLGAS